jgi:hypothetical protein
MKLLFVRRLLIILLVISFSAWAKKPDPTPTWIDADIAAKEYQGYQYQGEYLKSDLGIQVVAVQNRFYVSEYQGGLPGAGWDQKAVKHHWLDIQNIAGYLKQTTRIKRGFKKADYPAPKGAED